MGALSALKTGAKVLGGAAVGVGAVVGGCQAVYEWGKK